AAIAVLAFAALAAAVILYGITRHGLPTKSLLFRWQYWTASMPIIHQFPAWGTGLNNFGDYYLRFKAPSSPEDVQDPHNFFIRFAGEAGLPVLAAVTAFPLWLVWQAFSAVRPREPQPPSSEPEEFPWLILITAGLAGIAWALLRMLGI